MMATSTSTSATTTSMFISPRIGESQYDFSSFTGKEWTIVFEDLIEQWKDLAKQNQCFSRVDMRYLAKQNQKWRLTNVHDITGERMGWGWRRTTRPSAASFFAESPFLCVSPFIIASEFAAELQLRGVSPCKPSYGPWGHDYAPSLLDEIPSKAIRFHSIPHEERDPSLVFIDPSHASWIPFTNLEEMDAERQVAYDTCLLQLQQPQQQQPIKELDVLYLPKPHVLKPENIEQAEWVWKYWKWTLPFVSEEFGHAFVQYFSSPSHWHGKWLDLCMFRAFFKFWLLSFPSSEEEQQQQQDKRNNNMERFSVIVEIDDISATLCSNESVFLDDKGKSKSKKIFRPTSQIVELSNDQILLKGTLDGVPGFICKMVFDRHVTYVAHQTNIQHFLKYMYEPFGTLCIDDQPYFQYPLLSPDRTEPWEIYTHVIIMEELMPVDFLSITDFTEIATDILTALYELHHQHKYMHNDIKPKNIMQRRRSTEHPIGNRMGASRGDAVDHKRSRASLCDAEQQQQQQQQQQQHCPRFVLIDFDDIDSLEKCQQKQTSRNCTRSVYTPMYTTFNYKHVGVFQPNLLCPIFDLIEFGFSLGDMRRFGSTKFPQINKYLEFVCSIAPLPELEKSVYEKGIEILSHTQKNNNEL